ncbi:GST_N_2 domain-containing protein/GST_C_2 domain-containing protein [Cephalotus follicularis]|uniref:GST_N_2 domain-containing protein/GST_C_2 domain-containing protein n=1 Tax=Cephalotus follicularis TaxID=3775 RepID=A0A1Q3C0H6_CEPFO|nr:GST_N_2 domain-containing protein/GST_C_2 domain-containing protein [Cephalotus follicularis]
MPLSTSSLLASHFFLVSSHNNINSRGTITWLTSCHVSSRMSLQSPKNLNPVKNITNLLWGPSLPPNFLISTVRTAWESTWRLMMSQLAPSDPSGSYSRPPSRFRAAATDQFSRQNPNLHLYVGLPCPWAQRTLIVRALKGLEESVTVSVAASGLDGSWEFRDTVILDRNKEDILVPSKDNANGCRNLREVYGLRRGGYDGRATVPMLWDVESKEIVCNESYDIIQLFNSGLNGSARNPGLDLSPEELKGQIEDWNLLIYPNVNNGVYRCGFAQSQPAYDSAVNDLFSTLDMIDEHLAACRYLCGDRLTLADICLFTTLVRFDLVYNVLFKCTKKKLLEYPSLHSYMRDIYQIPKVAATCNFTSIMDGYYKILFPLNPGSIRPVMPSGCGHEFLSKPHNRESLSLVDKSTQIYVS